MPERIQPIRQPENIRTLKDIWNDCKDLQPGEWLPTLFWLADKEGHPIEAPIKVGRKTHESRLVFAFRITDDGVFQAHEAHATTDDDFEVAGPYPYQGLAKVLQEKYQAAGFIEAQKDEHRARVPETGEIPPWEGPDLLADRRTTPAPVPVPAIGPTSVYRATGSTRERLAAHRERALQTYWKDVRAIRMERHFAREWRALFDRYNLPARIRELPEARAKDGLILIRSRALRPGAHPESIADTAGALAETLTIRLLQKKRELETGHEVMDLLPFQKKALATLVQAVEDIGKSDSPLRQALIAARIEQVRLEVVVWYQEAGETLDLHVPIAYGHVPSE